jgi:serine/threonine protein kinase
MQGRPNQSGAPGRKASHGARSGTGADATTLRPGAVLGRYELVVRLARGATSDVWLAKGRDDEDVAIKALRLDVAQTPELLLGFAREVTIASHMHHPHLVQLVDSGRIGERRYLAMEYVDGVSLAQLGRSQGARLPLKLLARLLQQICLALHHAHELSDDEGWLGFLHRDVCPENILVSAQGVAKLSDFGAARMRSVPEGVGARTLRTRYAAPERVQGLSEDRRADLYAVGVILYEQATGVPAFQGSELELISQIVAGRPADPRRLVPDFPEALAQILARAMAPNPAERYPHCEALAADLEAFVAAANDGEAPEAALALAMRNLGHGPDESEPPWEAQPMPARPEEEGRVSDSRERFAPDADFSNDDITRPTVMSMPHEASEEALHQLVIDAASAAPAVTEAWLVDRQQALSRAPADIFGTRRHQAVDAFPSEAPAPERPAFPAVPPRATPDAVSDVFALYARGRAPDPVVSPTRPPPLPPRRPVNPAVQRFDRGLELLGAKLHELALAEWEEACRLDPENRVYQTNLKRLRAQLAARAGGQTERE